MDIGQGNEPRLISLECGEVEIFGPKGELHCDLSSEAAQKLKQILGRYSNNRPKTDANPVALQASE